MNQDIHQVREENQKEIAVIRIDLGERMEGVYSNLNKIDSKVDKNNQRIDEMHRREEKLQEEVDAWCDRPYNTNHIISTDSRDTINFRNYKRNPIEFLKRVEELIVKNRETRWTTVRGMLDEMFKETYDKRWTATRPDIQSTTGGMRVRTDNLSHPTSCVRSAWQEIWNSAFRKSVL